MKKENNSYSCLYMKCTHAENQLLWTGNSYYCNLHGSKFDRTGLVIKGPAESPMKKFKTEVSGDYIIITLI
jgi:Rieske Fe-S protein